MNYINQKTWQLQEEDNNKELLQIAKNNIEKINKWRDEIHSDWEPWTQDFEKCVNDVHELLRKLRINVEGNQLIRPQDTSRIIHKINYSEDKRSHVLWSIITLIQNLIISEWNRLQKRTMGTKKEIDQIFQKTKDNQ